MTAWIISVANPTARKGINPGCTDYRHSKFVKRRQYVEQRLLPQMSHLMHAEIFDAVTDEDFGVADGMVYYGEKGLKINAGNTGNFLSHLGLWEWCVQEGDQLLILEDDAELPDENQRGVLFALETFEHYDKPAVLHLLSAIPSLEHETKNFRDWKMITVAGRTLLRLEKCSDLSGTAAYAVNPAGAEVLAAAALRDGTLPTDGFIHRAFERREIDVLVPENYRRMFFLYQHFAEWNHQHEGIA